MVFTVFDVFGAMVFGGFIVWGRERLKGYHCPVCEDDYFTEEAEEKEP